MFRKTIIAMAAIAASGMVGSAAATTRLAPNTYYMYWYYSDATLSEQVGWAKEYCIGDQVMLGPAHGTWTPYHTSMPIGTCSDGPF